jgi:hypothetical protein
MRHGVAYYLDRYAIFVHVDPAGTADILVAALPLSARTPAEVTEVVLAQTRGGNDMSPWSERLTAFRGGSVN